MISNPPSDVKLLDGDSSSVHWTDWFENVQDQVNRGEAPSETYDIEADIGVLMPSAVNDLNVRVQSSTSGNLDITRDPQIHTGFDGQRITIEGMDDTKTVQLDDGDGLKLTGGASAVLKNSDVINLHYNSGKQLWIENSRSIN